MSKPTRPKKLVLKTLTLRKLTPEETGEAFGGACCQSAGCPNGGKGDTQLCITQNPGKFGKGWTVSVSFTLGPSKFGVSVGPSYSWGWTG